MDNHNGCFARYKRVPYTNNKVFVCVEGHVFFRDETREVVYKPRVNNRGYYRVRIKIKGIYAERSVHRLVASAFIANKRKKPEVNHIDCDKSNNRLVNLEWVTSKENMKHAVSHGFRAGAHRTIPLHEQVRILSEYEPRTHSISNLSRKYGYKYNIIYYLVKKGLPKS